MYDGAMTETLARDVERDDSSLRDHATSPVTLTDAAAAAVARLLEAEGGDLALRVAVHAGGCAGLQYQLYFDDVSDPGDIVTTSGGVRVVVDAQSLPYIAGSTIDVSGTGEQIGFTIANPNVSGGCACGGSCSCGCGC